MGVSVDGAGNVFAVFLPLSPGPRPTWLRWSPADGKEERGDLPDLRVLLGGTPNGSLVATAVGENGVHVAALR
jgi:hypothetical protein